MRLVLTAAAKQDLRKATSWYEGERAGLGNELRDELEVFLSLIQAHPEMFASVHPRVRRSALRRFPYSVFYTSRGGTIHILAILHNARDPELWKRRYEARRG